MKPVWYLNYEQCVEELKVFDTLDPIKQSQFQTRVIMLLGRMQEIRDHETANDFLKALVVEFQEIKETIRNS